jgi:hypothetical protein
MRCVHILLSIDYRMGFRRELGLEN